jgi:hypothetical protein
VLLLAIVLVKANWNPRALLVLAPLLIDKLLLSVLKRVYFIPDSLSSLNIDRLEHIFYLLAVGLAVLCLLSHWLGNRNRFAAFVLALVIMIVAGFAGAVSYVKFSESLANEITISTISSAILALLVLLGFVLAGWQCRKKYSGLRFTLWLGVWTIASAIGILLNYQVVAAVNHYISGNIPELRWIWVKSTVFINGLVVGGFTYAMLLPYVILVLCCSFFRKRFYACLHLKSMTTTGVSSPAAGVP